MRHKQNSSIKTAKSMMEFFMTLLWLFFGLFIVFSEKIIGRDFFEESTFLQGGTRWAVAILFILYSIFRGYRALQIFKNRNKNEE